MITNFNNIKFNNSGNESIKSFLRISIFTIIVSSFIYFQIDWGFKPSGGPKANLKEIHKAIDQYYYENKKYPKNLKDLAIGGRIYFSEVPIDPITGYADWEVSEKGYKVWYRTSDITYKNAPQKWNPSSESSIYKIRSRTDSN